MVLTGFQLRSARKALNLTFAKLSTFCDVSILTLMRLEKNVENLSYLKCYPMDMEKLYNFFLAQNLVFDQNTIALNLSINPRPTNKNLTRFQLIASRTAINLSHRELAKFTNLSYGSLCKFETSINTQYLQSYKIDISELIDIFSNFGITYPNNLSVKINAKTIQQQK